MLQLVIFVYFWAALTLALRGGDWIMALILLPLFLVMWTWTEDLSPDW